MHKYGISRVGGGREEEGGPTIISVCNVRVIYIYIYIYILYNMYMYI